MDVTDMHGYMRFRVAASFGARLKGLLGTESVGDSAPDDVPEMLCLVPCNSIHTFGMAYPIDVVFVDGDGLVVDSERSVPANRARRCRKAVWVGEREESPDKPWPKVGDRLAMVFEHRDESGGSGYEEVPVLQQHHVR